MLVETNLHLHPVSNRSGGGGTVPGDARPAPLTNRLLAEEASPLAAVHRTQDRFKQINDRSGHVNGDAASQRDRRKLEHVSAPNGGPGFLRCSQLFAASRWPHLAVPHKDRYRAACPGSRVQPASLITRRAQLFLDRHDPHFTRRAKHRARGHHLGRRQMASGCMNQASAALTRALLIRFANGAGSRPAVAMTVGGRAKRHVTPAGGHAPVMCGPA